MAHLIPQIKEIIISDNTKAKSLCNFFATKTQNANMRQLGQIFGIIEYEQNSPKVLELSQQLLNNLCNNYYFTPIQGELTPEILENRFEKALQQANINFLQLVNDQELDFNLEKLNLILVLVKDQNIYLSIIGRMNSFLIHQLTTIDYKIINILETTVGDKSELKTDPLKIFSQVIAGKILPRDILFLCTNSVLDYLSLEKIKSLIAFNQPAQAQLEFKKLLDEINSNQSFGLIIIKQEVLNKEQPDLAAKKMTEYTYLRPARHDSMRELIRTQESTQKILNTSYLPDFNKFLNSARSAFGRYIDHIKKIPNIKINNSKKIQPIKSIPSLKNNKVAFVWSRIINKTKFLNNIKIIDYAKTGSSLAARKINNFYNLLAPKSRFLFLSVLILIVIFIGGLIYTWSKNKNIVSQNILQATILQVQEKKNTANASLIYDDETKARGLLLEAYDLLNNLPKDSKNNDTVINLKKEIDGQLSKLRHLVTINEPTMLANFFNINPKALVSNFVVYLSGKLYTQDYDNQSIYELDISSRNINTVYQSAPLINNAKLAAIFDSTNIIFLNEDQKFYNYKTSDDSIDLVNIPLSGNTAIQNFEIYNQRLYFLDKASNQIYRTGKNQAGFSAPVAWLKQETDLSDVSSFTIDGQVYLLKNNGQIIRLLNGQQTDFSVSAIDPKLTSPVKIKTYIDSSYIYLLDPPTKRLVVIDKNGKLIVQYTSDEFKDLKDFAVLESNKIIYFLDGNKIFGIPASHL